MRKYILTAITVLPLLLSFSHAAQSWPVDPSSSRWVFPGDESDTGAYLGVNVTDVTGERLESLKLKEEKGVEVTMVDQDAPAGKAGIKEHDVILNMNGTAIESRAQLQRMIRETPPGRLVTLSLSRDGQPLTVKVQLGGRPHEFSFVGPKVKDFHVEIPPINIPEIEMPAVNVLVVHSSLRSGLMVENITPQLGEFFGVKNGDGVLIRSVEKGSRAEKAGFRAGDVIVKVNDQPVHDTSDFMHALRSRNGGANSVSVIRDKKEQNLNLTLPERKDSGELLDESFDSDEPLIDADSDLDLSDLYDNEMAEVMPQVALASQDYRKEQKELRKSLCGQQKQMRQEAEKRRKDFSAQAREQAKQKREMEKMMIDLDRIRQQMQQPPLDI
jgi:serine protease Do